MRYHWSEGDGRNVIFRPELTAVDTGSFSVTLPLHIPVMNHENKPTRKDLLDALVNQQVTVVEIKEVTMPPGMSAPKHLHPCPVVGVVRSGSVLFQIEGEESQVLNEGEAFYEPRNVTVLHFDNASAEKPLTFVAFYLKEADEENIELLA